MNSIQCSNLLSILADKNLKGKHLSADNFFGVIALKKKVNDFIKTVIESEQELMKEYKATLEEKDGRTFYKCDDPEFFKKLGEIQSKQHELPDIKFNFIPAKEFKDFTNDIDLDSAAMIAEHLLEK